MSNSILRRVCPLLALFLSALLIQLMTGPMLGSDDELYAGVAQSGDILGWMIERYTVWSSRSLIDLITILLVTHETLWMLLNALVITGMCLAISALASRDGLICFNKSALALACFWLIPASMMAWSVWWLTGSINYLWPAAASLGYWAVVKYEVTVSKTRLWVLVAGLAMLMFSAFSEQIMVVNFVVHGFLMCALRGNYFKNRATLIGLFVNGIGFAFFILSEGNVARSLTSAQLYFPEFLDFNVLEKGYFGISLGLYHFFYMGSWVSVILCMVIALRYDAPYAKYIAMASLVFIMLCSGYMLGYTDSRFSTLTDNIGFIGGVYQIDYSQAYVFEFYWALGLGMAFSVALAAALLGNLASFKQEGIYRVLSGMHTNRALVFVLSFIPSCMLGFSPTMYASQERVLFASTAILLLLIVMIMGKTRYSWHFLAATTTVAFFTYWSPPMVAA